MRSNMKFLMNQMSEYGTRRRRLRFFSSFSPLSVKLSAYKTFSLAECWTLQFLEQFEDEKTLNSQFTKTMGLNVISIMRIWHRSLELEHNICALISDLERMEKQQSHSASIVEVYDQRELNVEDNIWFAQTNSSRYTNESMRQLAAKEFWERKCWEIFNRFLSFGSFKI